MAGSLFWCLTARSYPDYDGFKVLLQQPAAQTPAMGVSRPAAVPTMPPKAKPGVVKRSSQQQSSSQQPSDIGSTSQEPSEGEPKRHAAGEGPAVGSGSDETRVQQQQQHGRPAQEPGSIGQGLRRVSTATEDSCSAAATMFEAGDAQSVEDALLLDAATVSQIVQHARLMKQLNGQETQRDCLVM
ncbi:g1295 [Coccomyxa elongata]